MPDRRVVIVVYPGCQALDLAGPHEVLAGANELLDARHRADPRYRLLIAADEAGPVRTESGLTIIADQALAGVRGPVDTLLVVGGSGVYTLEPGGALITGIRRLAGPARRVRECVHRRVRARPPRACSTIEPCARTGRAASGSPGSIPRSTSIPTRCIAVTASSGPRPG